MEKWRIAIVGTGNIAHNHMKAIQQLKQKDADVVAAMNPNPEKLKIFCDEYAIADRYINLDEMLAKSQPNFVIICSPPAEHTEQCIAALESGAHVLCEKPLAPSLADIDRIQAAEAHSGRTCTTGFQWRYGASGLYVKSQIDNGAWGQPLAAVCHTLWYRDSDYYSVAWRGKWATEIGGTSFNHGIHAMDFLLWLLGDWESVNAITRTQHHNIEVEDLSAAMIQFTNGAVASVMNSAISPRQTSYVRFDFADVTLELEHLYHYDQSHWRITHAGQSESEPLEMDRPDTEAHQIAQLHEVLAALDAGRPTVSTTTDTRQTTELISAIYKSGVTGQTVQRGTILPSDPFYACVNGRL
jgi:predicted dehydrogenase